MAKAHSHKSRISLWQRYRTAVMLVVVGGLITIAQTAWWVSHTIYDTKTFAIITTAVLTSESSRDAIANEVVNQSFANKPILRAALGKTAVKLVSGLLATDQANSAIQRSSEKIQSVLTSSSKDNVDLNLVPLKRALIVISTIAEKADRPVDIQPSEMPDTVTILNRNNLPNLFRIYQILLFVAPLCIVIALTLVIYLFYLKRDHIYIAILQIGIMLVTITGIGLITGPLVRPPVLSLISSTNVRVIVGNLYDGFIQPFYTQILNMGIFGIILIVAAAFRLGFFGKLIRKIRKPSR